MRGAMRGTSVCVMLCLLGACQAADGAGAQVKTDSVSASKMVSAKPVATRTAPALATARTPASCVAGEETIFTCKVGNGKRMSVCATTDGKAQYRYGRGPAELVLESREWAEVPLSGGGEGQIAFDNGDTRYIVFSRMVRTHFVDGEPNYPAINDGVVILKDDEFAAMHLCSDGEMMPLQYDAADKVMKRGEVLYTEETRRVDVDR